MGITALKSVKQNHYFQGKISECCHHNFNLQTSTICRVFPKAWCWGAASCYSLPQHNACMRTHGGQSAIALAGKVDQQDLERANARYQQRITARGTIAAYFGSSSSEDRHGDSEQPAQQAVIVSLTAILCWYHVFALSRSRQSALPAHMIALCPPRARIYLDRCYATFNPGESTDLEGANLLL